MAQKNKRELRVGEEKTNYQNDIMKIISYNNANDIVVEFQDGNHGTAHTNYYNFKSKSVKNPYHPEVCGDDKMVNITDVKQILQFAIDAEIKVFLDGGWGVDALLGYQSRTHNDIDIFVEKNDYQNFIEIMKANGFYEIKMEYTTLSHTVWEDLKNRIIDLHCFEYTDEGEILYDGDCFPAETFSGKGRIGEIEVSCIEPYSQVMFHLGYEFDENDAHDVRLLCETLHIEIPNEYR